LKKGTLYKYRTFGTIPSAPADYFDFYRDLEHWKKWDDNVEDLVVIEKPNDCTDIVYWAVKYPFPLSSRDYVYIRFAKYYESHKLWVITCTSCTHSSKNPGKSKVRVGDYKMVQVLREDDNGQCSTFLETFDDPQLNIPAWLLTWVTKTAIPKFMNKLNVECKNYKQKKKK